MNLPLTNVFLKRSYTPPTSTLNSSILFLSVFFTPTILIIYFQHLDNAANIISEQLLIAEHLNAVKCLKRKCLDRRHANDDVAYTMEGCVHHGGFCTQWRVLY